MSSTKLRRSILILALAITGVFAMGEFPPGGRRGLEVFAAYSAGAGESERRGSVNESAGEVLIAGDTESGDYLLYAPVGIDLDSRGDIFILDLKQNCVFKFDAGGNYVKTFGKKGEGPGELSVPSGLFVDSRDRVIVYEIGNRRFSVFDVDGGFIGSMRFEGIVWKFKVDHRGNYYIETRNEDFQHLERGTLVRVSRYSPDLSKSEPIDSALVKENSYISKPKFINVPVPFHPDLYWDLTPGGGVVVGFSDDYTIKQYSPALELTRGFHHKGVRPEVTEEDKKKHFEGFLSVIDGYETRQVPDYIRKATRFPKHKPFFNGLFVDASGRILVRTWEREGEKIVYDVFGSDGKFMTKRALPSFTPSAVLRGDAVYDMVGTKDETPSVVKYKLSGY